MVVVKSNDLVFLNETWQKKDDNFELSDYDSVFVPRVENLNNTIKRGHGGMGLLYKSTLRAGINIAEKDSSGFIIAQLKRDFFNIDKDLFICFVYIPPSTSRYYETPDFDYFDLLESKLVKYSEYGDFCIIVDLNARCGERSDYLNDQSVLDIFFY